MQRHPEYTRARIAALQVRLRERVHPARVAVERLELAGPTGRITLQQADRLDYRPASLGEELGPLFASYWLRCWATVPAAWAGARVDLVFSSFSEATLFVDGRPLQGFNQTMPLAAVLPHVWKHEEFPDRTEALLLEHARGGESLALTLEIACTGFRGAVPAKPYATASPFRLDRCELARFDAEADRLANDLDVLATLEREAGDAAWRGRLLAELNRFCNACDPDDPATWPQAVQILAGLLAQRNASLAHEITAIGHAHIDTAFLWPLAEGYRKCVRTFATQLRYMERYPEYRFACSQAVHHAWMKERAPELWQRIRERIASGQWCPVGGTWVEPDLNLPSGESLVRQFLVGQRFFERELGGRSSVFWNPDAFGYNGQLPQIMRRAGATRFLTMKLAQNRFNPPDSHSFRWQGIDGSEVTVHLLPLGTFNTAVDAAALRQSARLYKDHDRSRHSCLLFGHGDGGGGPTPEMLEALRRLADLQGVPRTRQGTPEEFFALLEADLEADPTVVVGELYLELHRGTYTSQARIKALNRRAERALHDAEAACALAHRAAGTPYPREQLGRCLRTLLLHQFHDVLPGTSIGEVYEEAERDLRGVVEAADRLTGAALRALQEHGRDPAPWNASGHARVDVAARASGELVLCEAPGYGVGVVREPRAPVRGEARGDASFILENGVLRAHLLADGTVASLVELASGREALAGPGNRLELYEDRPTLYDAWDVDPFHLETRVDCPPAERSELLAAGPLRAEVAFERRLGSGSSLRQVVRLDAEGRRLEFRCELDWHERHRLLKVAFPVTVAAERATYETAFGVARRPTHFSTPYDLARFEVPGHRFADLSEHGFGVAVLTDSKYGYSTFENTIRVSLVRAPTDPDPEADQGRHAFAYAVVPHRCGWQEAAIVAEAAAFNAPLRFLAARPRAHVRVEDRNLVLDTVKLAEDGDGLVLRLYEAHGARGTARVVLDPPAASARRLNLLEDDEGAAEVSGGAIVIAYRPFEIVTLAVGA